VHPDPVFRRVGDDLHRDLEVPVTKAVLGGKVPVRTLRGTANLTVPSGTSSGALLRLRGQGVGKGDLIVRVLVAVPKHLSDRERKLYEELSSISCDD
jgi:DnaJ-class molecular chaperone